MSRILLLHKGMYGHTLKISEFLSKELAGLGDVADVRPLEEGVADARSFDALVLGAAIRHGKHNPLVVDFVSAQRPLLESMPSAFFSVNLVARKPHKRTPQTNPYVKAFLEKSPWQPKLVGVFGGVLDYRRYNWFDRHAIRMIMHITKGPTDFDTNTEFTDWDDVKRFAVKVHELAATRP